MKRLLTLSLLTLPGCIFLSGILSKECGDGILDAGEECDEGSNNADASDACRASCLLPRCGDGITDTASEVCDDGNNVAGDSCRADCQGTEQCG